MILRIILIVVGFIMKNKTKEQIISKSINILCILLDALNVKFRRHINKLSNRIKCEHLQYYDVYCKDTGLFMYCKCCNCGKKKY